MTNTCRNNPCLLLNLEHRQTSVYSVDKTFAVFRKNDNPPTGSDRVNKPKATELNDFATEQCYLTSEPSHSKFDLFVPAFW